ncbi:MAG TPA: hypothetical protein VID03_07770 [Acidimicrobiia bacterium]|jgi:hypothetical protein
MADYQITCVSRQPVPIPIEHSHVVVASTGNGRGKNKKWAVAEVSRALGSAHRFYTEGDATGRADVEVVPCPICHEAYTLTTGAGTSPENSIEALPDCEA